MTYLKIFIFYAPSLKASSTLKSCCFTNTVSKGETEQILEYKTGGHSTLAAAKEEGLHILALKKTKSYSINLHISLCS